jgi:hypothetical protein
MDARIEFLNHVRSEGLDRGQLVGLLHILIGRKIQSIEGTVVSQGITWRDAASLLKKVRWPKDAVKELKLDPENLPQRDRERYWYAVITQAHVDSEAASQAGDKLAEQLRKAGYQVGPAPGHGAKN